MSESLGSRVDETADRLDLDQRAPADLYGLEPPLRDQFVDFGRAEASRRAGALDGGGDGFHVVSLLAERARRLANESEMRGDDLFVEG